MQEIIFELLGVNSKTKMGLNPEVTLSNREQLSELELTFWC